MAEDPASSSGEAYLEEEEEGNFSGNEGEEVATAFAEEEEDENEELEDGVVNNVGNWRLTVWIDGEFWQVRFALEKMYYMFRHLSPLVYRPDRFGSLNEGFEVPPLGQKKFKILVFVPGTCVGPGASSGLTALLSAHLSTLTFIERWGIPLHMTNFNHSNIVVRTHVDHRVDLRKMANALGTDRARYDPDPSSPNSFPACFLRLHGPWLPEEQRDKVKALVYSTGRIVITGIRSEADVERCESEAKEIATHFKLDEGLQTLPSSLYYSEKKRLTGTESNLREVEETLGAMDREDYGGEIPSRTAMLVDGVSLPSIEYKPF